MRTGETVTVEGYELALDRLYDLQANLWVAPQGSRRARVGYDPLGAETTGDVVAISFPAPGERVARGGVLATVEAAKFVGPVRAPVGGVVAAVNERLHAQPGLINSDPLDAWLVELDEVQTGELEELLLSREARCERFAAAVARFRRQGAIAQ